jgi:class 3 adenylate cyclase
MAAGEGGTVTRGFLFADLRGYTDFVERHGAAAAAALLTRYRELARAAIARAPEALRAHAVDPDRRYATVLGTIGVDANGDSTQQVVSLLRVDPAAADGAGDWVLVKQQDFGPAR